MKKLIFILAILLTGCATTRAYVEMLDGWKGKPSSALVDKWGKPNRRYTMEDGSQAYEYRWADRSQEKDQRNLADAKPGCVTTFALDAKGKIVGYKWSGHDCRVKK